MIRLLAIHRILQWSPERAQILDKEVEWTWSGLCEGGSWYLRRCRRTAVLPGGPDTPRSGGTGVHWSPSPRCCALVRIWIWNSPDSRSACCTQTHCRLLAQFCWCLCRTLRGRRRTVRSRPPPSNSDLSDLSCSAPGPTNQSGPDVLDTIGAHYCKPQPGSVLLTEGSCGLCLGPDSREPELMGNEKLGENAKPSFTPK